MKPKVTEVRGGAFQPGTAPALLVGASLASGAAPDFLSRLRERFGADLSPRSPAGDLPDTPFLLIGGAQDHPELRWLVAARERLLPGGGLGAEGYLLEIAPERVLLAASDPAGALYGVLQLLETDTGGVIGDKPTMPWRGMHLLVRSRADLPDLETILAEHMPRHRLNRLILEINYHFRYQSHPEVTEGDALTREDCRRLTEIAARNGVRLIPMLNCLGHQSWAEHTSALLQSHPEFDETPDYPADNKGIYCRSWCPSHPEVNRVVFALIDELIDAFEADAFHVGMDEVFILGECPRCKGTSNAELFAKAVNDLHAHLAGRRGVRMLLWGDRLLDSEETGYGKWEASANGTAPAIELILKDIIICDWHYETLYGGAPATYPSVRYFQDKGFAVWPSGWNSEENARMLAACALRDRSERMLGYLATTWIGVGPVAGGLSGDAERLREKHVAGVAAAIRTGARIAWEGEAVAGVQ